MRGTASPVVCRGASDDTVKIFGETLRFLEGLLASRRTAVPVGQARRTAVESRDDRFGADHHFVFRAIRVVDNFFRASQGEACAAARVTRIGGASCIAVR